MGDMIPFVGFPKIARWSREVIVTEKLDGSNAVTATADHLDSIRDAALDALEGGSR